MVAGLNVDDFYILVDRLPLSKCVCTKQNVNEGVRYAIFDIVTVCHKHIFCNMLLYTL